MVSDESNGVPLLLPSPTLHQNAGCTHDQSISMLLTEKTSTLLLLHHPLKVFDPDAIPFIFFPQLPPSPHMTVSLMSPTFRHYLRVNG